MKIYDYRAYIRRLYWIDTSLEGDLHGSLLELSGNIEKLEINLDEFYINITLQEEYSQDQVNIIISEITDKIQKFVLNNIEATNIPNEEKENFRQLVESGICLFDYSLVGNVIMVSL